MDIDETRLARQLFRAATAQDILDLWHCGLLPTCHHLELLEAAPPHALAATLEGAKDRLTAVELVLLMSFCESGAAKQLLRYLRDPALKMEMNLALGLP